MTHEELYQMIKLKFKLVKRPTNDELEKIANSIIRLSRTKQDLDDDDLLNILNDSVENSQMWTNESVDMTASINLINQILAKLNNGGR